MLRHPARSTVDKLLADVKQLVANKVTEDAIVYEKKLRVIQKQTDEIGVILKSFDAEWVEARTSELAVDKYEAGFETIKENECSKLERQWNQSLTS